MEGNATESKYQFFYFNLRGRGEAIRYLFADQGIEYEQTLVDFEDWPSVWKPQMQFGQLPCLKDGGLQIVQFNTILRHLGRKHNLYGDPQSIEEPTKIDMISDGVEDVRKDYTNMIYQNYENGKEPYIGELPKKLAPFEKFLSENDAGKTGCCVGSKKSFVDYNLFDILDIHLVLSASCLDKFPTLAAFHQHMLARPGIQNHRGTELFKNKTINYGPNQ